MDKYDTPNFDKNPELKAEVERQARENADKIENGDPFATGKFMELCNGSAEDRTVALLLMKLAGLAEKVDHDDGTSTVTFKKHIMAIIWLDGNKRATPQ